MKLVDSKNDSAIKQTHDLIEMQQNTDAESIKTQGNKQRLQQKKEKKETQ